MKPAGIAGLTRQMSAREFSPMACAVGMSLALSLLAGSLFLAGIQVLGLFRLDEAGYGDSYILYDVLHFQRTGEIYRDLSQPPYLPAQYSPLVYMLYSLPRWNPLANPFIGPRLVSLAMFVLCIAMVLSLVRKLMPIRYAWLWGLLLASSIVTMAPWVYQLRGDFPAAFLGLAAIRLLMARPRYLQVLLAGLCAGLAVQFKFVYLASFLAGSLWLVSRRRFKQCAVFVAGFAVTSVGLYFLFWLWQPRMVSQMLALSPGIPDYRGWALLVAHAAETPVLLLALPAVPVLVLRAWHRWRLLLLFALMSFLIAAATDIQAGGNINYFFEGLFAVVPLAVFGIYRMLAWSRDNASLALFLVGLTLIGFLFPLAETCLYSTGIRPARLASDNALFRKTAAALHGLHIFSTVPRLALLDPEPAVVEPSLISYLRRLGKFDAGPILQRVRSGEFDVVIIGNSNVIYRTIPHIDLPLQDAIGAAYQPYCTILGRAIYLPRSRPASDALVRNLREIGCESYPSAAWIP